MVTILVGLAIVLLWLSPLSAMWTPKQRERCQCCTCPAEEDQGVAQVGAQEAPAPEAKPRGGALPAAETRRHVKVPSAAEAKRHVGTRFAAETKRHVGTLPPAETKRHVGALPAAVTRCHAKIVPAAGAKRYAGTLLKPHNM